MKLSELTARLQNVSLMRILLISLTLTISQALMNVPPVFQYFGAVYFLVSLFYLFWLRMNTRLRILAHLQLWVDAIIINVLILMTGGVESMMILYDVLIIIAAGFLIAPIASLVSSLLLSGFLVALGAIYINTGSEATLLNYFAGSPIEISEFTYSYVFNFYVRITALTLIGALSMSILRRIERMESKISLHEHYSALGESTAQLAHELRNPLMTISGSVELLAEDLAPILDSEQKRLVDGILQESTRIKHLFDELLEFARPLQLSKTMTNITQLVEETVLLAKSDILNRPELQVSTHMRKNSRTYCHIDPERIRQVIFNILKNAAESIEGAGKINISIESGRSVCRIRISDSGRGIEKNAIDQLFIPFRSGKLSGNGIGLALSMQIMRKHGGDIIVRSTPRQGSDFSILLNRENEVQREAS